MEPKPRSIRTSVALPERVVANAIHERQGIIAVRGDVLRHIDLLQNVDIVTKHGKRWK